LHNGYSYGRNDPTTDMKRSNKSGSFFDKIGAIETFIFIATVSAAAIGGLSSPKSGLLIALLAAAAVLGVAVTLRFVGRVTSVPTRIVIGGHPEAGKTVFANVSYNRLLKQSVRGVHLFPKGDTAVSVAAAIRSIEGGTWPSETEIDEVREFSGLLELRSNHFGWLPFTNWIFPFKIVDTPGAHWVDPKAELLERELSRSLLSYAAHSKAIIYVIDIGSLNRSDLDAAMAELVNTLYFLGDLNKKAMKGEKLDQPIAIVISKCDELSTSTLRRLQTPKANLGNKATIPYMTDLERRSKDDNSKFDVPFDVINVFFERVDEIQRFCRTAKVFLVSSVGEGFVGGRLEPIGVVEPLTWCFREVGKSRRALRRLQELDDALETPKTREEMLSGDVEHSEVALARLNSHSDSADCSVQIDRP
jgi:hypothetical protein